MATVHLKRWLGVAVVAGVVSLAGGVAYGYWRLDGNLQTVNLEHEIGPAEARPPKTPGQTLNVLVLGKDDGRSDTAMVVNINAAGDRAKVISIPRDTMVARPACGTNPPASKVMFNSAFTTGGAACAVKTVEAMSGIRIDHFIQIDFSGFARLVDAIGGVEIEIDEPIHDEKSGLSLDAGKTTLNGQQALAFVRTRYSIGDGSDLNRIKQQHKFLQALSAKLANENWLGDPVKTFELADDATKSIVTDEDLGSLAKLADLAEKLHGLKPDAITYQTLPTEPYAPDPNRVQPKEPEADQLWELVGAA
ncbi:transcriptional regulator [Lentzea sp. NBRC 105346]|uniref:LCP family protein n=1 Tax=Lentzea sp. NBRC 105346 TaxID=3032205 RepID=UPI0024A0EEE8|nr:LCP family protein [Lentzea sp. NBRC 105346]GLZ34420.1 transcriptional regulator [Lentzea sp. NBRC 105346]